MTVIARLWHELTTELLTFVKEEYFKTNGGLIEVSLISETFKLCLKP